MKCFRETSDIQILHAILTQAVTDSGKQQLFAIDPQMQPAGTSRFRLTLLTMQVAEFHQNQRDLYRICRLDLHCEIS